MPTPNADETEKEFIDRCIPIVIDDGTATDTKQAYAICKSKWDKRGEDKNTTVKVGARHSQRDQRALQDIHDAAITLGATCPQPQGEITEFALMSADKTMVVFGTEVKALGDGKIAGYLVRYGGPDIKDLTGEYFTAETDFGDNDKADVYYHHGADKKLGKRKLAKGQLTQDEIGVWIETQLNLRDEYERAVYGLAERNKLGWSSGTAAHLVEKDPDGRIKTWPLGLDASLTPTPAEPRNITVIPLKSYLEGLQVSTDDEAEGAGDAPPIVEETPTITINQEQLDRMVEAAAVKAAKIAEETILEMLRHR